MPNATQQNMPVARVPFTNAAHEHTELIQNLTITPTTARQTFGPFDIPSYGYLRKIKLALSTLTPGVGGVLKADGPAGFLTDISVSDVNGGPLFYPTRGYTLQWVDIMSRHEYRSDPRVLPSYSNSPTSPGIQLTIPHEVTSFDGYGSLANQDSSANYKLSFTVPALSEIYSTVPTTAPVLNLKAWEECWTVPNTTDIMGNPQAQAPPQLGSARYVSSQVQTINAGLNTIPNKRVGNLIECLILIARNAAGDRADNVLLDPLTFRWDGRDIQQGVTVSLLRDSLYAATNGSTTDVGVVILPFNKGTLNGAGNGPLRQLLPTVQSSRQEFVGNAAAAGTLEIVTMDMTVTEIDAQDRYVLENDGGFHPEVGTAV